MANMTVRRFDTHRAVPLATIEREWQVPGSTLRRWARNGTLPAYKLGRDWRVMPEHVAELLTYSPPREG